MAVLHMQRFAICALKKDRKKILELLQQSGVTEVDKDLQEDDVFKKMDTQSQRTVFDRNTIQSEQALDILQNYVPEKKSMFAGLEGKPELEYSDYCDVIGNQDKIMATVKKLVLLDKKISENNAVILKRENQLEALEPWKDLDVPMDFVGTKKVSAFIGTLPVVIEKEAIQATLVSNLEDDIDFDLEVISIGKDQTYISVMCLKTDGTKVEEALRMMGFARPTQVGHLVPIKRQESLKEKIAILEDENKGLIEEIQAFASTRVDIQRVSDYYRTRSTKYEVLGGLLQSKNTFTVTGYVPTRVAEGMKKGLEENFTLDIQLTDAEDEDVPVILDNNTFSESFEGVVGYFGLPKKGELDPTMLMSFFYFFLFGLMLSDAAYGAVITIVCFVVLKKFPRMGSEMKKSIKMFMYCGISTMFWGVMFGSYFGDVVDIVGQTFFGVNVTIPAIWFVPLDDPMRMLVYSMLFGVIHLFAGLGIKGYMLVKDKEYMDFFSQVVCWFTFLIGLILILLPSEIFESISQMSFVFPPALTMFSKVATIAGALGLLLFAGWRKKNWGLRIALGAYELYNTTGWLSDVLSYSRLLALGLATGVIASVINQMGSMAGGGVFGAIVFILVFLGGHTFNICINLLGAYVHTNRLQFVEYFGKFYEGGGRAFEPFTTNTKYVDIKEEMKL